MPNDDSRHRSTRSRQLLTSGDVLIDVVIDDERTDAGTDTSIDSSTDTITDTSAEPSDPAAPAIVLLPSSQRDSFDFDDLAARIASAGFRVLRPQPRGMGRSRGPMTSLSLGLLADDVAFVIESLGGGRAVIAGHAFGHFIARVTDLEHPTCVRGVVVVAGAARSFPVGVANTLAIASDPLRPASERLEQLQRGFFAPGNDAAPWLDGWHPALRDAYRAAGATPSKDAWWPVSHSPILELIGESDAWRPAETWDELKRVLGDKVTVRHVAGAGHAMVPEQPAAVADAIVGWMRTLPP